MRSTGLLVCLVGLAAPNFQAVAIPHALAAPDAAPKVVTVTQVVTILGSKPPKTAPETPDFGASETSRDPTPRTTRAAGSQPSSKPTSGGNDSDSDGTHDSQTGPGADDAGSDDDAAPRNGTRSSGAIKLAAWWGSSGATDRVGLDTVCAGDAIDAVILAFVTDFFGGPGGRPVLGFTKNPGALAPAIRKCQARGKKVLLSLGGATASGLTGKGVKCAFASDAQGTQFAQTLWDQFLGGSAAQRPFGDVKLDGIDIDNESDNPTGYGAFAKSLRAQFARDASKAYLLTAAPGCDAPSKSIPTSVLRQCDYVFAQFYDNPGCAHGTAGFAKAVRAWSKELQGSGAKLSVGGTAYGGSRGFLAPDALAGAARGVRGMGLPNFAGYALWDASWAMSDGGDLAKKLKAVLM